MTDRILVLADQVFRLVFVVRNAAYHRSLHKYKDEFVQNYWILIFNNFLDIAVLEWCKVFGSSSDATHWSNDITEKEKFRTDLMTRLDFTKSEWEAYWNCIKSYRDCVVAHHEHNPNIANYPDLDPALISCYFYYEILIKELRSLHVSDYPDNLEKYFNDCLSQSIVFSDAAYKSTVELDENVY